MNRPTLSTTTLLMVALLSALFCTMSFAADKIVINKADDLPRYTYKITMKATAFLDDYAAITKLSAEVKKDLEADLAKYDIKDNTTLQGYYQALGTIELLSDKYDTYLTYLNKRKDLESKEANKLTMGLVAYALANANLSKAPDLKVAFKAELKKLLDALPYETVQDNIKSAKGSYEMMNPNMTLGGLEASVQPVLDKSNGEISKDIAVGLLGAAFSYRVIVPMKDDVVEVYTAYLDAKETVKAPKPDIWADREVKLTEKDGKPVILAVWDSGVDQDIFKSQMWTNTKEIPNNNIDDDKNGFVDDVHGIAWGLHNDKEIPLLFPIGDVTKDRPRLERLMKGLEDLQANLNSPEAKDIKQMMSTLPQDSVKPVFEGIGKYGNYCHGTHVTGISVNNNPLAQILAARMTYDYHMQPELPTEELARKDSIAMQETVAYFKKNGVRVVNMSWGGSLGSVEAALEANNAGGTPEERKALSRKLFEISKAGLFNAIKNAPEILFVTSAGNSDNNVKFEEFYPSSFDLPNMITVGAVDQAGEETSFTSFGKVDVYANGFEVLSYVPGGNQMKLSGTSMSSPNVMNLAGKLLAKNSKITMAQLRELIIKGCDEKTAGDHKLNLINPKKSFELLAALKTK